MNVLFDDAARAADMAACLEYARANFLTVKEYAALIRQHPLSVYRRIREGRQAGVIRLGRDIRIDLAIATAPPPVLVPHGRLSTIAALYTGV